MKYFTQADGLDYSYEIFLFHRKINGVSASDLKSKFDNPNVETGAKIWSVLNAEGDKYVIELRTNGDCFIKYNRNEKFILDLIPASKTVSRKVATVKVKSFSNKNKSYEVAKREDGSYSCTCPDFENRAYHFCKHITRVQTELDRLVNVR